MLKLKTNYYKILLRMNKVIYGKNLSLIGLPVIFKQKNARLNIGSNCTIKSDFLSNLVGLFQRTIIVARAEGIIEIGDNVGISGATIYSRNKIQIGSYTNIGGNVKILDNDFHPIDPEKRRENDVDSIDSRPIKIGTNVFVGCNSIILKGSEIGDNCVIGAGSVVSGKFPDNTVIAGNPARVVKTLSLKI